jgi:enterochelin esterase-like enzyme
MKKIKILIRSTPLIFFLTVWMVTAKNAQPQTAIESPRLAALASQIEKGDKSSINNFWQEIEKNGTPLVEPAAGEKVFYLVTFLYHGSEETENVVLFIDRGLWGDIASNQLYRLGTTNIWFKTYRFRNDARFTYSLSVNDPLKPLQETSDVGDWIKRSASWITDPLNPKKFPFYPRPVSVVELPGAPPQPWITLKKGVPKGKVTTHKFKSNLLDNERTVWIYIPSGYDSQEINYGMLILFDGGSYISWVPTPTILDNLIAERLIPSIIAVFVSHPNQVLRNQELSCSESFTQFLVEELVPWVKSTYQVTENPALTIIGGSSNGGLGATYAAFRHPEVFGNVLSQSGAFMYSPPDENEPEWLIRKIKAMPPLPIRFHLDYGLMETSQAETDAPSILETNRHLSDVLLGKGYRVHYREFNGGHEYINWRGHLANGLIALLGGQKSK